MKRNSNSRVYNQKLYESFSMNDTRYYGVFLKGQGENRYVQVDPKRYKKVFHPSEDMLKAMGKRKGPLFRPAKKRIDDYTVNFMLQGLSNIRYCWKYTNKPMKDRILSEICGKEYAPYDDELAMSGILDYDEAVINANMKTLYSHLRAEKKKNELYYSLYAQYFHQMASQVEALFIKMLTRNGFTGDRFDRNVFYSSNGKEQKAYIKLLDGFSEYDKLYNIWAFIKHNSLSTYILLKEKFPDVLLEGNYSQGDLACFFVKFDDELFDSILVGIERFIKNYCRMVYGEDEKETSWNSDEYFISKVHNSIDESANPLGLPDYI